MTAQHGIVTSQREFSDRPINNIIELTELGPSPTGH